MAVLCENAGITSRNARERQGWERDEWRPPWNLDHAAGLPRIVPAVYGLPRLTLLRGRHHEQVRGSS